MFLLADTSIEIILAMLFFIFSNTNIEFVKKESTWRSYTIAKALAITKKVQLINKKYFAKAALNKELNTFVIYVTALEALEITIHLP